MTKRKQWTGTDVRELQDSVADIHLTLGQLAEALRDVRVHYTLTDADCLDTAKTIAAVAREACDAVVLLVSTADFIRRKAAIAKLSGEGT